MIPPAIDLSWQHFNEVRSALTAMIESDVNCPLRWDEPSRSHVTFQTGGTIGLFVEPQNVSQVRISCEIAHSLGLPVLIIGRGSNTLIRDGGFPGLVIAIADRMAGIEREDYELTVRAGTSLKDLSLFSAEAGMAGLEWAVDIPGTLGGALYMNAGMYDDTISDRLRSVTVLTDSGQEVTMDDMEPLDFGYRRSSFQTSGDIVVAATFSLSCEDRTKLLQRIEQIIDTRQRKFPLEFPNAGSIFKRPPGNYAGALIEQSALKGYRFGGAMVSPKHANFIVNAANASATDIENLSEHIIKEVQRRFGITLEREIRIFGLPGPV